MDGRINTTNFTIVHSANVHSTNHAAQANLPKRRVRSKHGRHRMRTAFKNTSLFASRSEFRGAAHISHASGFSGNRGLLLLLGVCTSAFMMLFALQIIRTDYAPDALAVIRSVMNNSNDDDDERADDTLGKLQLVQLPSILEVFAPSNAPIPPLSMSNAVVDDESYTAKIYAPAGTLVTSVLAGTVKSVVPGDTLGGCVVVSHPDDIEVYYYGLGEILVERGQPILQNSSIGTLSGDILYLRVTKAGRPLDPFDFLGIKAEVGG